MRGCGTAEGWFDDCAASCDAVPIINEVAVNAMANDAKRAIDKDMHLRRPSIKGVLARLAPKRQRYYNSQEEAGCPAPSTARKSDDRKRSAGVEIGVVVAGAVAEAHRVEEKRCDPLAGPLERERDIARRRAYSVITGIRIGGAVQRKRG